MDFPKVSKKKPCFPTSNKLQKYCEKYNRNIEIPIFYDDLLRFLDYINVFDNEGNDTHWIRVYYPTFETEDILHSLKKVYAVLHSDGRDEVLIYLNIDAIDFCTFGNSKPFRIKVRNILNDNFTYFYVKKTDASRIYGLEFEHMLSPYNLNFLIYRESLIEEHIAGIPGDIFFSKYLPQCSESEKSAISKEFVKFNERCMIRLLGDMRSYNFVVTPTHDFNHVEYKIRAIDFDQQSYEGNLSIYRPQFFEENQAIMTLIKNKLHKNSIRQYKLEERSIIARRIISFQDRLNILLDCMKQDTISALENVTQLKNSIYTLTRDISFKKSNNMGEIMEATLSYIKKNYENKHLF